MASYRQNAPNIVNRSPFDDSGQTLSRAVYGPGERVPSMENPTRWTPFGIFNPRPYFGGWDGLGGALMHVEQADMYDVSPNPFPANGVLDQPGAAIGAVAGLLRLEPTTSAHPGNSLSSGYGPTMVFQAPPVFSMQTRPIFALGV